MNRGWQPLPVSEPLEHDLQQNTTAHEVRSHSGSNGPVLTLTLTEAEVRSLIQRCKQDTRTVITQTPSLLTHGEAQRSMAMDGQYRVFTTGVNRVTDETTGKIIYEPVTTKFLEGTKVIIESEAVDDWTMKLNVNCEMSQVDSVRNQDLTPAGYRADGWQESKVMIQIPTTDKVSVEMAATIKCGDTLVALYPTTRTVRVKSPPVPGRPPVVSIAGPYFAEVPFWDIWMITVQRADEIDR